MDIVTVVFKVALPLPMFKMLGKGMMPQLAADVVASVNAATNDPSMRFALIKHRIKHRQPHADRRIVVVRAASTAPLEYKRVVGLLLHGKDDLLDDVGSLQVRPIGVAQGMLSLRVVDVVRPMPPLPADTYDVHTNKKLAESSSSGRDTPKVGSDS